MHVWYRYAIDSKQQTILNKVLRLVFVRLWLSSRLLSPILFLSYPYRKDHIHDVLLETASTIFTEVLPNT